MRALVVAAARPLSYSRVGSSSSVAALIAFMMIGCGRIGFDETVASSRDANGDAVADPSLLAWYPMDGDPSAGAIDASGHGRLMACGLTGCPTARTGHIGGGFAFTSGVYLHHASDSEIAGVGAFTVALWLWVDTPSAAGYSVFAKTVGSTVENSWDLGTYSSNIPAFCTSADGNSNSCDLATAAGPVATWYHLAGTWDGSTKRIYVNGVARAFSPRAVIFDTHDITLGCDDENGSLDWCLEGAIDDVRLYDRALSDAEIAMLSSM
jgi:hypothetical protein